MEELVKSDNASFEELETLRNQLSIAKKQNNDYEDQLQVQTINELVFLFVIRR